MKERLRSYSIVLTILLSLVIGCSHIPVNDPRPPLMDNNSFVDFVPTVVTNVMETNITNSVTGD